LPASRNWPTEVGAFEYRAFEYRALMLRALEARASEILERSVRVALVASSAGPIGPVCVVALIGVGHASDRPSVSVAGQ